MKILFCLLLSIICSCCFAKTNLKVLSIGNSYSHDGFCYVPFLIQDIDPEIDLTLSIAAIGGCTLQRHVECSKNDQKAYDYHKCLPGAQSWIFKNTSIKEAILDEEWDIIILQQQSENSQRYDTYQPYLNELIDYIFKTVKKPVKLVWHLTPSYGHIGGEGIEMYNRIAYCAKRVLEETPIECVIPNGTAIQNARGTYLKELGDKQHLSGDNLHMQEGLPKQIEAYTTILTLLDLTGRSHKSIFGNKTLVNDKWLKDKRTWGTGKPVGSITKNLLTAQKCAIMAHKYPFKVSEIK